MERTHQVKTAMPSIRPKQGRQDPQLSFFEQVSRSSKICRINFTLTFFLRTSFLNFPLITTFLHLSLQKKKKKNSNKRQPQHTHTNKITRSRPALLCSLDNYGTYWKWNCLEWREYQLANTNTHIFFKDASETKTFPPFWGSEWPFWLKLPEKYKLTNNNNNFPPFHFHAHLKFILPYCCLTICHICFKFSWALPSPDWCRICLRFIHTSSPLVLPSSVGWDVENEHTNTFAEKM